MKPGGVCPWEQGEQNRGKNARNLDSVWPLSFYTSFTGDLLQSVNTFPVMTSRLFLTAASFTDGGGSLEVGGGCG